MTSVSAEDIANDLNLDCTCDELKEHGFDPECDFHHAVDQISQAEQAAANAARRDALEEAAKVCDNAARKYDEMGYGEPDPDRAGEMMLLAQECRATRDEIRALKEQDDG